MAMPPKFRALADDLRAAILAGEYPPGSSLPTIADLAAERGHGVATVSRAYDILAGEGLVNPTPRGTVVLPQRPVQLLFSRYRDVLEPSGLGPFETACQRAGVDGEMMLLEVEWAEAPPDVAGALGLAAVGRRCVCRTRHATISGRPVQLQTAWYPPQVADAAPVASPGKLTGGSYAALTSAGMRPMSASERVRARPATGEEAAELRLRGEWVLDVRRVTKDIDRRPLEFLHVVCHPAYTDLDYDELPIADGN